MYEEEPGKNIEEMSILMIVAANANFHSNGEGAMPRMKSS
jgi:hypothetical protein